jgi:MFS family permease
MSDAFRAIAIPISGAAFASLLGFGMMVPALPLLAHETGSGALAGGMMVAIFGIARLCLASPSGIMVDRIGVARTAVAGLVLLGLASLYGIFAAGFVPLLIAIGLQGAGSSIFATAAMTALVLQAGPQHRGRAMSWFQTAMLMSFSVGPLVGGEIVDRFGSHAPFAIQAALAVLALAAVSFMPTAAPDSRKMPSGNIAGSIWSLALLTGAIGGFAAFFSRVGMTWNIVPAAAMTQFEFKPSEIGWVVGVGTAANLLAMPFLPKLIDGWGPRPSFLSAATLAAAGVLALYIWPSVAMLWIATAAVTLGTGVMIPAAAALSLQNAAPQATGRIMGLFRTASDSGMALGPIVIPAITRFAGISILAGLLICAVVLLTALALVAVLSRQGRNDASLRSAALSNSAS